MRFATRVNSSAFDTDYIYDGWVPRYFPINIWRYAVTHSAFLDYRHTYAAAYFNYHCCLISHETVNAKYRVYAIAQNTGLITYSYLEFLVMHHSSIGDSLVYCGPRHKDILFCVDLSCILFSSAHARPLNELTGFACHSHFDISARSLYHPSPPFPLPS